MSGRIEAMKYDICPMCDSTLGFLANTTEEAVKVRGELFPVASTAWECLACHEVFEGEDDPFDLAYRVYRVRHNVPQPEEIRAFRDRAGLTQRELADLLSWGHVTLSRYENGALASEAHARSLKALMDASTLADLIEADQTVLTPEKRNHYYPVSKARFLRNGRGKCWKLSSPRLVRRLRPARVHS